MTEYEVNIAEVIATNDSAQVLNLTTHRATASVWDTPAPRSQIDRQTVGLALAIVGGGVLMLQGLRRGRTRRGQVLLGLGGALGAWGLARSETANAIWRQAAAKYHDSMRGAHDLVLEASDQSFPASDPPSWTPTTAGVRH